MKSENAQHEYLIKKVQRELAKRKKERKKREGALFQIIQGYDPNPERWRGWDNVRECDRVENLSSCSELYIVKSEIPLNQAEFAALVAGVREEKDRDGWSYSGRDGFWQKLEYITKGLVSRYPDLYPEHKLHPNEIPKYVAQYQSFEKEVQKFLKKNGVNSIVGVSYTRDDALVLNW